VGAWRVGASGFYHGLADERLPYDEDIQVASVTTLVANVLLRDDFINQNKALHQYFQSSAFFRAIINYKQQ